MKTALVTGTSSGIGWALSGMLLAGGFKVYGVSREATKSDNPNFVGIQADLTDPSAFHEILKAVTDDSLNVLINNAGVAFEQGSLLFNEKDFNRLFNINFKAPILLVKELREKIKKGLVINISSVSNRLVGKNYALYCSSKAALNVYFDVMALEEKGMLFISILPSYVDTPLLRKLQKSNRDFDWNIPLKPDEVAEFVEQIVIGNKSLPSGARVIIVSEALKDDLNYAEELWGYNATTKELFRVKQN